jgi:hypothetical protein
MQRHMSLTRTGLLACLALVPASSAVAADAATPVPRYDHIFVIVAENKGYNQLMSHPEWTPAIHKLADAYGSATQFYGEVHSSEGNYVAMLGGDTFGIHDDDAFYCQAGVTSEFCEKTSEIGYADHALAARSLMDQLTEKGLTWKAYVEDLPSAGSLVPRWPNENYPIKGMPNNLYAAKHNGFVNFKAVHNAPFPALADHIVGFRQLDADIAAGKLPNYAHIVPNQCNDMHGLGSDDGGDVPKDCDGEANPDGLIKRGDAEIGSLVDRLMHSAAWTGAGNTAIVVTFDENNKEERKTGVQGCCASDPKSLANFGGGHIVTLVITNHGPRHAADPTPYNHYSLLRTTEQVFGIDEYLGHAADTAKGVVAMNPLFAVSDQSKRP